MKIPYYKPLLVLAAAGMLSSCSSTAPKILSTPIENIDSIPLKVTDLSETQLKGWGGADLVSDTIPGMSVKKAYDEIIKDNKGKTVIVGVVDSGVDIDHEDLKDIIWTNKDEIPNNGKDDDHNGYVDDIHGWNFLGGAVKENLEYTRIYKRLKPKYENKPESSISTADMQEYDLYKRAKAKYEEEYQKTLDRKNRYEQIKQQLVTAHQAVSSQLGKEDYTKEELAAMPAESEPLSQYKDILMQIQNNVDENIPDAIAELDDAIEYYSKG